MLLHFEKYPKFYWLMIVIHVLVGLSVMANPWLITLLYVVMFLYFLVDTVKVKDIDGRAGIYIFYLISYEVVYRMGGEVISWEFGKYVAILMSVTGILVNRQRTFSMVYLFLLFLLIPSIFLASHPDPVRLRKMVMFNISGPLSLIFSALYFYKKRYSFEFFSNALRIVVLPAIVLLFAISLKSGIDQMEFVSVQSNEGASGDFAANQVSVAFGWLIMVMLMLKIQRVRICPFEWMDWLIIGGLVLRGLLTFSRGGILSALLGLLAVGYFLYTKDNVFRSWLSKRIVSITAGFIFIFGILVFANNLTGNYLLYRYQGKTTNEVESGVKQEKSILTGRDKIMKGDFAAFKTYPILGVGYGMAVSWHKKYFGMRAAAHTEYARLLSEHGLLGLIFIIIAFIILPLKHFYKTRNNPFNLWLFAGFIIFSMTVMFHAAMRLAIPGVLYGASFVILFYKEKSEK